MYLTALTVLLQVLVTPSVVVKADTTTWDTYELNSQWADCMYTTGAGLLHGSSLVKTRDYSIVMSAFWYFNAVNITSWGQVSTAYLSVYRVATGYNASNYNARVYAIDLADDMGFYYPTGPITDPATRPLTSAYTLVNDQDTDDWAEGWLNITVTDQVIEVVRDQYAWAANNSLSFRLTNIVGADRYVRAYEHSDHTYGAKLYIERKTSTSYAGGWDNAQLANTTGWGELWEVWNGTRASFASYYTGAAYLGRNSTFQDFTIDASTTGWFGWNAYGQHYNVVTVGDYAYMIAWDSTTTKLRLLRSNDGGKTWAFRVNVGSATSQSIQIATDGTDKILMMSKIQSSVNTFYTYYDVDSLVDPSWTLMGIGASSSDVIGGVFYYNSEYYMVGYYGTYVKVWKFTPPSTWDSGTTIRSTGVNALQCKATFWTDDDGLHFYVGYRGASGGISGIYRDHDTTLSSPETLTIGTAIGYWDLNHFSDGSVRYMQNVDATGGGWTRYDLGQNTRSAGLAGTWGSNVLALNGNYYEMAFNIDTAYNGQGSDEVTVVWLTSDPETFKVSINDSGSFVVVDTKDAGATINNGRLNFFTFGAEGDHYYQFHFYNCTWLPPTPTPIIPPNPWVPIADPDPDEYPDPTDGYLGRLNMRLYLIIIGLGLFVIPPIMWSQGRTEMLEIGAGLIAMLFGVALLMAAGHV